MCSLHKRVWGTLSCTALAQEQIGFVFIDDAAAVDGHGIVGECHQSESHPKGESVQTYRPVAAEHHLWLSFFYPEVERLFFCWFQVEVVAFFRTAEGSCHILEEEGVFPSLSATVRGFSSRWRISSATIASWISSTFKKLLWFSIGMPL